MLCPTHLLHSSPYPHLPSLQPLDILLSDCPGLRPIEYHTPHQCFNQSFHLILSSFSVCLGKYREVVSRCLPLGVFMETPSPSVDVFNRPSFCLFVSGGLA